MHVLGKGGNDQNKTNVDQRLKCQSMSVSIKLAFGQRTHGCMRSLSKKKRDNFSHNTITDIDATHII